MGGRLHSQRRETWVRRTPAAVQVGPPRGRGTPFACPVCPGPCSVAKIGCSVWTDIMKRKKLFFIFKNYGTHGTPRKNNGTRPGTQGTRSRAAKPTAAADRRTTAGQRSRAERPTRTCSGGRVFRFTTPGARERDAARATPADPGDSAPPRGCRPNRPPNLFQRPTRTLKNLTGTPTTARANERHQSLTPKTGAASLNRPRNGCQRQTFTLQNLTPTPIPKDCTHTLDKNPLPDPDPMLPR